MDQLNEVSGGKTATWESVHQKIRNMTATGFHDGQSFTDAQLYLLKTNNIGPDVYQLTVLLNALESDGKMCYIDFLFPTNLLLCMRVV